MAKIKDILPFPAWDAHRAEDHREKHSGCFEQLLGISGREVTLDEYKNRSQRAIDRSWAEFEATKEDNPHGANYVDDQLVQAIITPDRRWFMTCFHKHFRDADCTNVVSLSRGARRIKFRDYLNTGQQWRVFTNVKWIRGERD